MSMNRIITSTAALLAGALFLTGCTYDSKAEEREKQQDAITLEDSLEEANLKEKLLRENDPTAIRYVYLFVPGDRTPVGFYVIKGKVSSSGSQLAPEQEIVRNCATCTERSVVDSAQDDGTFGEGDPGVFFFTADGGMVITQLVPLESDVILPIDVPRLGGQG